MADTRVLKFHLWALEPGQTFPVTNSKPNSGRTSFHSRRICIPALFEHIPFLPLRPEQAKEQNVAATEDIVDNRSDSINSSAAVLCCVLVLKRMVVLGQETSDSSATLRGRSLLAPWSKKAPWLVTAATTSTDIPSHYQQIHKSYQLHAATPCHPFAPPSLPDQLVLLELLERLLSKAEDFSQVTEGLPRRKPHLLTASELLHCLHHVYLFVNIIIRQRNRRSPLFLLLLSSRSPASSSPPS